MISRTPNSQRVVLVALLATLGLMACGDEPIVPPPGPSTITGTVTIDGVGASGLGVDLTGGATASATTDGSGSFSFADLAAGSYTVTISGTDAELVNFDMMSASVELAAETTETVTFTGTPTGVQRVLVHVYYGIDGTKPGVAPASGMQVDVYPTSFDRTAGSNRLDRTTTDANGVAALTFDRSDDSSDGGGATDNTVYTQMSGVTGNRLVQADGEQMVSYLGHEVVSVAPDTVDILNGDVTVEYRVQTIQTSYSGPEGSALLKPEWISHSYTDTAGAQIDNHETGFDGVQSFFLNAPVATLPITVYFRLQDSQGSDAGNIWTQTPEPTALGAGTGRFMTYVHDGTQAPGMADLGIQRVEYVTQAIFAPVHHETDNAEASPIYTPGSDDTEAATSILLEVLADDQTTVLYSRTAASNGHAFWNGPNFPSVQNRANLIAQNVYFVRASSQDSNIEIVTPSVYQVGVAGGGSVGTFGPGAGGFRHSARLCPLAADTTIANCSGFAYKYNNTQVTGTITASGGGPVANMTVELYRCTPPDTASCTRDGSAISTTTNGSGVYTFSGNLEDIYEVVPNAGSAGFSSVAPAGGSPIVVTGGSGDSKTKDFTAS